MYDDTIPLNDDNDYSEASIDDPSAIHHCYHKLFKLADNMNTNTAKEIAKERTNFMKLYVNEFLDEWNGIK